jgi:quercetin dioxygenase-like cupin family protein
MMNNICVHEDKVEKKQLPGRSVKVLTDLLLAKNITFGICELPPNSAMDPHRHVQEELIFILQGYGFVNVAGKKESITPGTLVHFPSGEVHFTVNESNQVMKFTFCFSPQVVVGSYDSQHGS